MTLNLFFSQFGSLILSLNICTRLDNLLVISRSQYALQFHIKVSLALWLTCITRNCSHHEQNLKQMANKVVNSVYRFTDTLIYRQEYLSHLVSMQCHELPLRSHEYQVNWQDQRNNGAHSNWVLHEGDRGRPLSLSLHAACWCVSRK